MKFEEIFVLEEIYRSCEKDASELFKEYSIFNKKIEAYKIVLIFNIIGCFDLYKDQEYAIVYSNKESMFSFIENFLYICSKIDIKNADKKSIDCICLNNNNLRFYNIKEFLIKDRENIFYI